MKFISWKSKPTWLPDSWYLIVSVISDQLSDQLWLRRFHSETNFLYQQTLDTSMRNFIPHLKGLSCCWSYFHINLSLYEMQTCWLQLIISNRTWINYTDWGRHQRHSPWGAEVHVWKCSYVTQGCPRGSDVSLNLQPSQVKPPGQWAPCEGGNSCCSQEVLWLQPHPHLHPTIDKTMVSDTTLYVVHLIQLPYVVSSE